MQYGSDEGWSLTFAVFDENLSWYNKDNMQMSKLNSANPNNTEFYNSNVIYSKNASPGISQRTSQCHPLFREPFDPQL